jgi:hypothetical protein
MGKRKTVALSRGFLCIWLVFYLAISALHLHYGIQDNIQQDQASPGIHNVLEVRVVVLNVLPAPYKRIDPADKTENGLQQAFFRVHFDKDINQAPEVQK